MSVQNDFSILEDQNYMSLKTFRKSGEGVATPVWFAQVGDKLYVTTLDDSGKVKRLRHTSTMEIAPCDASGNLHAEYIKAQARILEEGNAEAALANRSLNKKYGWQKRLLDVVARINGSLKKRVFLEVTSV